MRPLLELKILSFAFTTNWIHVMTLLCNYLTIMIKNYLISSRCRSLQRFTFLSLVAWRNHISQSHRDRVFCFIYYSLSLCFVSLKQWWFMVYGNVGFILLIVYNHFLCENGVWVLKNTEALCTVFDFYIKLICFISRYCVIDFFSD